MAYSPNSPRNNSLSDSERLERQDDLEKAIGLFNSIAKHLNEASVVTSMALHDADKLFGMCNNNLVLRAAMVSRRLSLQKIMKDIKGINTVTLLTVKLIGRNADGKDELERIVQDPDLLR